MGQAKRRGTFEERKAAAIAKRVPVNTRQEFDPRRAKLNARRKPLMAVSLVAALAMGALPSDHKMLGEK